MGADARRSFALGPCLGRGGYGEVYRATTVSAGGLSSQVAIKLVRAELDVAADAVARLRDEARLLSRLAHPNIVRVIDLCRVADDEGAVRVALVTELVEGRDLDHLRQGNDPIPLRAACEAIAKVARALDAAYHTPGPEGAPLGVVHRDVKPGNIAIGRHGDVKLLDFGIARFEGEEREARTATAMLVGSLPYLAPERFLEREVWPASDVFALACVLFECAAAERWYEPVPTRSIPALASDRDRYEAWRWERLEGAALPEPLRPVLASALAWKHADRPSAASFADRLDALELPGPALRTWCRAHTWVETRSARGSLEGRTLVELAGDEPAPSRPPPPRAGIGPRLVHRPMPTIDPGPLSGAAPRVAPVAVSAEARRPKLLSLQGTHFVPMVPVRAPARPVVPRPAPSRAPRLALAIGCAVAIALGIAAIVLVATGLAGAIAWVA